MTIKKKAGPRRRVRRDRDEEVPAPEARSSAGEVRVSGRADDAPIRKKKRKKTRVARPEAAEPSRDRRATEPSAERKAPAVPSETRKKKRSRRRRAASGADSEVVRAGASDRQTASSGPAAASPAARGRARAAEPARPAKKRKKKPPAGRGPAPARGAGDATDLKELTRRKYAPGEGKADRCILISTREDQESREKEIRRPGHGRRDGGSIGLLVFLFHLHAADPLAGPARRRWEVPPILRHQESPAGRHRHDGQPHRRAQ